MIVLKLGFSSGWSWHLPFCSGRLWAFLAPALYAREKKALVPSLFIGLLLFMTGVALAYFFVVPQALRVLFSFQTEAIAPFITYDKYFSFVMQVTLALGISFELPLVIIILSWLGVIGPAELSRFRRFAVVLRVHRRCGAFARCRRAVDAHDDHTAPPAVRGGVRRVGGHQPAALGRQPVVGGIAGLFLLLALFGTPAEAQQRPTQRRPQTRADSLRDSLARGPDTLRRAGQSLDTATAARMGLPTGPIPQLRYPGFGRQRAARPLRLSGHALPGGFRDGIHGGSAGTAGGSGPHRAAGLDAGGGYDHLSGSSCLLDASGEPKLFDRGQVLIGERSATTPAFGVGSSATP